MRIPIDRLPSKPNSRRVPPIKDSKLALEKDITPDTQRFTALLDTAVTKRTPRGLTQTAVHKGSWDDGGHVANHLYRQVRE